TADHLTTSRLDLAELRTMLASSELPEPRALEILDRKGVRVVRGLPELPVSPPVPTFATLRDKLRTCEASFSPEVVFGSERLERGFTVLDGFRLADGTGLDGPTLDAAAGRLQVEAHSDGR